LRGNRFAEHDRAKYVCYGIAEVDLPTRNRVVSLIDEAYQIVAGERYLQSIQSDDEIQRIL